MHHLANLATLHNQRRLHALAHRNQVVVNSRYGQKGGNGGVLLIEVTICEDDVVYTLIDARLSPMAQVIERLAQAFLTTCNLKQHGEFLGLEPFITDVTEYVELCVGQNRLWQTHHLTVRRIGCQDIGSHSANILRQRHHQFLADGIDGGVRHLSELLAEIIEEYLRAVADDSQRGIVAHCGNRFLTCRGHRDDGLVDILLSEAESDELLLIVAHAVLHVASALQLLELHAILVQPFAIRMCLGQLFLDLAVVVNLTLLGIDEQNLTRLQTPLANHVARFEVHHTNL